MDSLRFDSLAKALAAPTRRGFLRAALAAAGLAATSGQAAAGCKSHADCSGCRKCSRKRGRCVKGCPGATTCRGGRCAVPCATTAECGACEACADGFCTPDPGKAGRPCGGCRTCGANGSCGVPSDDRCDDGQLCRPSTGICCPVCVAGGCCGVKEACIDPGAFAANSCCDTRANTPCGGNGDGTFTECCSNRTEECCDGECVPKGECCGDGRPSCDGTCCPTGSDCCGGACVNTQSNARHCGACGTKCGAETDRCHEGTCRHFCTLNPNNTVPCGGSTSATAFCCHPDDGCCGDRCCP
jgi:hypothetical protein